MIYIRLDVGVGVCYAESMHLPREIGQRESGHHVGVWLCRKHACTNFSHFFFPIIPIIRTSIITMELGRWCK